MKIESKNKKPIVMSLGKMFFLTSFTAIAIALVFFVILITIFIKSEIKVANKKLEDVAQKSSFVIQNRFYYLESLAKYIGKQIAKGDINDLDQIAELMKDEINAKDADENRYILATSDWVNTDKQMLVNNLVGVLEKPVDMSIRDYLNLTPLKPWTLQTQDPAKGLSSGKWVVPSGIGITDNKNNYIGTVTLGLTIQSIYEVVLNSVDLKDTKILVLTDKYASLEENESKNFSSELSTQIKNRAGLLSSPITYKNIVYNYYYKMDRYDFIVLSGYEKGFLFGAIMNKIILDLAIFIILMVAVVIGLIFIKKLLENEIKKINNIDDIGNVDNDNVGNIKEFKQNKIEIIEFSSLVGVKQNLLKEKQLSQELVKSAKEGDHFTNNMSSIYADGFEKILVAVDKIKESSKKDVNSLDEIENVITDLYTATSRDISVKKVNIYNLIEESVVLNYNKAIPKDVILKNHVSKDIGEIYADPIRLKQIIVALIANAILLVPEKNEERQMQISKSNYKIEINANYDNKNLVIMIKDNCSSLSPTELYETHKKLVSPNKVIMTTELPFGAIYRLVVAHKGFLDINTAEGDNKMTIYTLTIPNHEMDYKTKGDNVVSLDKYR